MLRSLRRLWWLWRRRLARTEAERLLGLLPPVTAHWLRQHTYTAGVRGEEVTHDE